MRYNKLVRNKIPEIIKSSGKSAKIHRAQIKEYKSKLLDKLLEESKEYLKSKKEEELADILEVVYALSKMHKLTNTELESLRKRRARERGAFDRRIILEEVE